jgi:parallel beta-helix repeat protein
MLLPALVVAAMAALLFSAGTAAASVSCDKVASPTGSDSNAGTVQLPFRTANKLVAAMSSGQTGCLRAGTFTETLEIHKAGLTLTSYPGERATIRGDFYASPDANGMTVSNLNLDGRGIYADAPSPQIMGDNITFDNDDITNYHTAICVALGSSAYGRAENVVIENSRIHDCGKLPANGHEHGIYVEDSDHVVIRNNVIDHNADYGIHFFPDGDHTTVTGNVIDSNGSGMIFSGEFVDGVYQTSDNNVIEHNLITNSLRRHNVESVYPSGQHVGVGNVVTDNCIAGAYDWFAEADGSGIAHPQEGFVATNNFVVQPQYADPANGNYSLPATDPCAAVLAGGNADPSIGPVNAPPSTDTASPAPTPTPTKAKKKRRKRAHSARNIKRRR